LSGIAAETDLLIEVGPGAGLCRLARQAGLFALSIDAFGESLHPLLCAIGAAFVLGHSVDLDPLFHGRSLRVMDIAASPRFLSNPCGSRDLKEGGGKQITAVSSPTSVAERMEDPALLIESTDPLTVVRDLIAAETGFAASSIKDDDRFLDNL